MRARIFHLYRFFALAVLLAAVAMNPAMAYDLRENAVLHANQGQTLMERGQYEEAIEELKSALRLNPYSTMSAALYNNLGLAYRATKQYPLAIASFQYAMRIQPTYALYYKNLIETYADAGQLSVVENLMQGMLRDNPGNAEALFLLGLLYNETLDRKQSKAYFKRYLELEPESGLAPAARAYL